jgi:hypothetical protein
MLSKKDARVIIQKERERCYRICKVMADLLSSERYIASYYLRNAASRIRNGEKIPKGK